MEAEKQTVIYLDFELTDKQFEGRYSENYENHYEFDDNFIRIDLDPEADIAEGQTFEQFLNHSLEQTLIKTGAKIVVVDNLTYLRTETEKAKDALPLMKELKALKSKYRLSILALAHTPKRDLSKPITRNDLQGSKMLINFCDSSFAIGECHTDKSLKYIKQIKARSTEIIYDGENVCVFEIGKIFSFLKFSFLYNGAERQFLKQPKEGDDTLTKQVVELKEKGLSYRDIGKELGINQMKAQRLYKKSQEKV